jgi:sugar/nucleoside kinase (ribokinase family)
MYPISKLDPIDYLVIGHITRDLIPDGSQMGGTASYAALTAHALGLRVGVVTSWGEELPLNKMADIAIINQLAQKSTTFENIYTPNGRYQIIHSIAHPLNERSIPESWFATPIVHLGPVAQEVSSSLTQYFPNSLIGVTPQGWLRTWDESGRVHPKDWEQASEVLAVSGAAILSVEDVTEDEDTIEKMASSCQVFVVTEGYFGARVYWHGDVRRMHAPKVVEVDSTGAGDIFAAAFFTQYHKTSDPWESARFANVLAAQSVTRTGLASVPTRVEVKNAIIEVL